ncbi:type III pantothenate kinase [Akkermansiaceae bacterium]|nr:type III pantothenate kinase [Akkermansiaceae bacterium]
MAWLLIDNSNSRTKLALGDRRGLLDWRAVLPTAELGAASLDKVLAGLGFEAVAVASVVPGKAGLIASHFGGEKPVHFINHESPLGYRFCLEHPDQIGSDRLANAVALRERHGFPGIAVDFGTAVTFSALSADGDFLGGAIAPGMAAMTSYLAGRTAQLPSIEAGEPVSAIGKTTVEAMEAGAVFGHRGMVAGILRGMLSGMPAGTKVVATGGGAAFAARGLGEIGAVDPDLTLEGIRLVARRIFCEGPGKS